jgi:hypothetical protein
MSDQQEFTLGPNKMPTVKKATNLGIIRTQSLKENMRANVDENIKKARRSAYSLFGSGFHGYNGLDIDKMLHLFKIYVTPILLYGLELILPTANCLMILMAMNQLELSWPLSLN